MEKSLILHEVKVNRNVKLDTGKMYLLIENTI